MDKEKMLEDKIRREIELEQEAEKEEPKGRIIGNRRNPEGE